MTFMNRLGLQRYLDLNTAGEKNGISAPIDDFYAMNIRITRTISKIVAFIWYYIDTDDNEKAPLCKMAKEWFLHPTQKDDEMDDLTCLEKLMYAEYNDETCYGDFLRNVFPYFEPSGSSSSGSLLEIPIISEPAKGGFLFVTKLDTFYGYLTDPEPNEPGLFKLVIAFPPRPALGAATVTKEDLLKWIKTDETVPSNPYIPLCSS